MTEARPEEYANMFNAFTSVPHRALGGPVATFRAALDRYPDIASRALVYLYLNSKVRDLQEAAIIALLQAEQLEYREAAQVMLLGDVYMHEPSGPWGIEPYRIFRVLRFLSSRWVLSTTNGVDGEVARFPTQGEAERSMLRLARSLAGMDFVLKHEDAEILQKAGLRVVEDTNHRPVYRRRKRIATDYLQWLQANTGRWYAVELYNQSALHYLYANPRETMSNLFVPRFVRQAVFEGVYPDDSSRTAVRTIVDEAKKRKPDTALILKLVEEHRLPFRIVQTLLPDRPWAKIVEIQAMSPAEARNARASLEASGVLEIPEVKQAYLKKVAQRGRDTAGSIAGRASTKGKDAEVEAAVQQARAAAARTERIEGAVGVEIDISGSMNRALQMAATIGAAITAAARDRVWMSFFNENATAHEVTGMDLTEIEYKIKNIRSFGSTSMEAGYRAFTQRGFVPNKLVIVTDGGENSGNLTALLERQQEEPQIVIVRVPGTSRDVLSPRLRDAGRRFDVLEVARSTRDDGLIADQVAALLGGPRARTLGDKIADTELPRITG